jgi:hypothetical protein
MTETILSLHRQLISKLIADEGKSYYQLVPAIIVQKARQLIKQLNDELEFYGFDIPIEENEDDVRLFEILFKMKDEFRKNLVLNEEVLLNMPHLYKMNAYDFDYSYAKRYVGLISHLMEMEDNLQSMISCMSEENSGSEFDQKKLQSAELIYNSLKKKLEEFSDQEFMINLREVHENCKNLKMRTDFDDVA